MTATTVRPEPRPQALILAALLQQQLAIGIKNEHRKRPMQQSTAIMAGHLAQVTGCIIQCVYEDQFLIVR
jgi:hypothetical protein